MTCSTWFAVHQVILESKIRVFYSYQFSINWYPYENEYEYVNEQEKIAQINETYLMQKIAL